MTRLSLAVLVVLASLTPRIGAIELRGSVVDSSTAEPLPARLYIVRDDGKSFFARSASRNGSAIVYDKQRGDSAERHTTLSAHPFVADLPAGSYTLTVERGKEYLAATRKIRVVDKAVEVRISLRRFIDMAKLGWYSGETHVHRPARELPHLLLAEDLNVAFPLTYWVTHAYGAPKQPAKGADKENGEWQRVDATHAFHARNTEYEIFSVDGKGHTLGAVFLLRHRTIFDRGVPPVGPIAKQAHAEGALLELDKHNWPWSMAIIPVMKVDLYELTNNHVWRTDFHFKNFGNGAAAYMKIDRGTEEGWIDFGFQNYYALLDCGFRLRPTAGTASGVHPVPLGFGRVYVELEGGFDPERWLDGLNGGRSFVTTGPMLVVRVNDKPGGHRFELSSGTDTMMRVTGECVSAHPLGKVEVIVNGEVARVLKAQPRRTPEGAFVSSIRAMIPVDGSSWVAVRAYSKLPGGRIRFAHSSPVFFDVAGEPLRPRRVEVEYLAKRVREQITRSKGTIPQSALDEYRSALRTYEALLPTAR